jgi:hypothetical protein
MMVPIVQRRLIAVVRAHQPDVTSLYDPFVGAGTALVAGMYHGLNCYGQDINPLALLVTRVKTGPCFLHRFKDSAEQVLSAASKDRLGARAGYLEKWFTPEVATGLSRLQRAILTIDNPFARRFLWVTLAETTRLTSNDRTSTYKLHARPLDKIAGGRPDPWVMFESLVTDNLRDLQEHHAILKAAGQLQSGRYSGTVRTSLGDSSISAMRPARGECFDIVVTSPPYGDNTTTVTYGQHSYLPLQWIHLGDIDSEVDPSLLRTTQELDRRSLGGGLPKLDDPRITALMQRSQRFAETLHALTNAPDQGARRVASFVMDLDRCLSRIASRVRQNGYLIWTIGNRSVGGVEIPNDVIIANLFEHYGVVEVARVARTIHSKRMAPRNGFATTMATEQIVIFRQQRDTRNV